MKEIWKPINSYNGYYEISDQGRVKNVHGKIMAQKPSKDGYVRIQLRTNGKYKAEYVHILVASAFVPNPEGKPEVNHLDADKSNNKASNLEWVTRAENHHHAVRMGLKPVCPTLGKYGADNPCVTPVLQFDLSGRFIKEWSCRAEAASHYGCRPNDISRCMNGVRKTCKGYIWKHGEK